MKRVDLIYLVMVIVLLLIVGYKIIRSKRYEKKNDSLYLEINKQYSELLKLSLDTPELRDYNSTFNFYELSNDNLYKKKYNIYASMYWNLVETIYDQKKKKKGRFKLNELSIPVLLEENRLHYTWFKHNIRLFKPGFQKFVSGELNDIDVVYGDTNDLNCLYLNFERDFPQNERKELEHLEMLMFKGKYKLLLAKHKVSEAVIGYALIFKLEKTNQLWLDYIAIEERYQNFGYGTLLFNKIIDLESENITGMFIEIEYPDENDKDYKNQLKRVKFYDRLGAKKLDFNYILPTNDGGLPIGLYYKPIGNINVLTKEKIKETIFSSFNYIHTDIDSRDSIFKEFVSEIDDVYFN
jgi:GNAT superfamily N-acetyltransferase